MPTAILAVDDEPDLEVLIRQAFRKQIREDAYTFAFARDGVEALERLGVHPDVGPATSPAASGRSTASSRPPTPGPYAPRRRPMCPKHPTRSSDPPTITRRRLRIVVM